MNESGSNISCIINKITKRKGRRMIVIIMVNLGMGVEASDAVRYMQEQQLQPKQ
jgi:hypothetical protein